jgi:hypothetical protein
MLTELPALLNGAFDELLGDDDHVGARLVEEWLSETTPTVDGLGEGFWLVQPVAFLAVRDEFATIWRNGVELPLRAVSPCPLARTAIVVDDSRRAVRAANPRRAELRLTGSPRAGAVEGKKGGRRGRRRAGRSRARGRLHGRPCPDDAAGVVDRNRRRVLHLAPCLDCERADVAECAGRQGGERQARRRQLAGRAGRPAE